MMKQEDAKWVKMEEKKPENYSLSKQWHLSMCHCIHQELKQKDDGISIDG